MHRKEFEVQVMCDVLDVSRSGYFAWRTRFASQREMADAEYIKEIKRVFDDSRETYGYESIWRILQDEGIPCGKHRVRRLMRQEGLVVKQTKRYKRTTKANPDHQPAPNELQGNFEADRPNEKWCADITYIPTQEGWLYLAVILDLFSWRISKAPRRIQGTPARTAGSIDQRVGRGGWILAMQDDIGQAGACIIGCGIILGHMQCAAFDCYRIRHINWAVYGHDAPHVEGLISLGLEIGGDKKEECRANYSQCKKFFQRSFLRVWLSGRGESTRVTHRYGRVEFVIAELIINGEQ
jgi:hypothetical protein